MFNLNFMLMEKFKMIMQKVAKITECTLMIIGGFGLIGIIVILLGLIFH